jgi:hypothetical protein
MDDTILGDNVVVSRSLEPSLLEYTIKFSYTPMLRRCRAVHSDVLYVSFHVIVNNIKGRDIKKALLIVYLSIGLLLLA